MQEEKVPSEVIYLLAAAAQASPATVRAFFKEGGAPRQNSPARERIRSACARLGIPIPWTGLSTVEYSANGR